MYINRDHLLTQFCICNIKFCLLFIPFGTFITAQASISCGWLDWRFAGWNKVISPLGSPFWRTFGKFLDHKFECWVKTVISLFLYMHVWLWKWKFQEEGGLKGQNVYTGSQLVIIGKLWDQYHSCQLSRIQHRSPALLYWSPYLPDKLIFELFCALVWNLTHFLLKTWIFLFAVQFRGHFCTYLVTDKDYFWHQNDDCEFW